MSEHTDDLRFPHLRVCREHGRLYDPAPHPESGQQQTCHGPAQPKWDRFDFNEWVHLCECCVQDTIHSGSRWSGFFCQTCRVLLKHRAPAVPIGRHSMMNGGALPPQVDAAHRRLFEMGEAQDALHAWSRSRLLQLVGDRDADPSLKAVVDAARRQWDKERAVADLAGFWRPSRNKGRS